MKVPFAFSYAHTRGARPLCHGGKVPSHRISASTIFLSLCLEVHWVSLDVRLSSDHAHSFAGHCSLCRELLYGVAHFFGWSFDVEGAPTALGTSSIPPATTMVFELHHYNSDEVRQVTHCTTRPRTILKSYRTVLILGLYGGATAVLNFFRRANVFLLHRRQGTNERVA